MKISTVIVNRANFGRLKPVLLELDQKENIDLNIICSGTMPLERYGMAIKDVEAAGLKVDRIVYCELDGGSNYTMSQSIALSIQEHSRVFLEEKPDFLLVIGDRYEALGAVIAAAYMNISIIHLQGGETSGCLDECARHAISKFAHYHFPATERSREFLVKMGENVEDIFNYGCPVADVIPPLGQKLPEDIFKLGVGADIDINQKYLLVIFHPDTFLTNKQEEDYTNQILNALVEIGMPTIWLWPNIDAGSDNISKVLRVYREKHGDSWLRLIKNFSPEKYQLVLQNAACAIGNSSSFVRDSTFTGVPVVLIGDRQEGREMGDNILKADYAAKDIKEKILTQLKNGRYSQTSIYGQVGASKRIADQIAKLTPKIRKRLQYLDEYPVSNK